VDDAAARTRCDRHKILVPMGCSLDVDRDGYAGGLHGPFGSGNGMGRSEVIRIDCGASVFHLISP